MFRAIALAACLFPAVAFAQTTEQAPASGGMNHQMMMQHMQMMNGQGGPTEPGQAAFGAIQEIVGILEADPKTDWSKVNIDALRSHLVDMNAVTLLADVKSEPVEGGMKFMVTGTGPVTDSIRRMVTAHAMTMNGVDGWQFAATEIEGGSILTVLAPAADTAKLRGLGFFGILTVRMHHQEHHLMIARGESPHH